MLNSTSSAFDCSNNHSLPWTNSSSGSQGTQGADTILITLNDGDPSRGSPSSNYAGLEFLQAVYYHKTGDDTLAVAFLNDGAKDYNGTGVVDAAFSDPNSSSYHRYQTCKVALYIYAAACTASGSDPGRSRQLPTSGRR